MAAEEITYSFKEVFDRFEQDVRRNFDRLELRLNGIETAQDKNSSEIEQMKGKMIVYGSISIIVGTAIASLAVKLIGN